MSDEGERRIRRRVRRLGGVSQSSQSTSANIAETPEQDDPDLALPPVPSRHIANDVEGLEEMVREVDPVQISEHQEFTPRARMADVRTRGGAYEREYRLGLLHRLLMRKVPLDQIASELEISVQTVLNDRRELFRRLRAEAAKLDVNQLIGETMSFYREIQGMSLRSASNTKVPMNLRIASMRTAMSAKNDEHRFLSAAGVYDVLRYRAVETTANEELSSLVSLTKQLLEEEAEFDKKAKEMPDVMAGVAALDEEDEQEVRLL